MSWYRRDGAVKRQQNGPQCKQLRHLHPIYLIALFCLSTFISCVFLHFEKKTELLFFTIFCCRVILIFYEFQFLLKICPSKRHREFKRVEIRTGANFPNRSSPLLDSSASRANQSEGESKIARLIALFRTWCQTSQSLKTFWMPLPSVCGLSSSQISCTEWRESADWRESKERNTNRNPAQIPKEDSKGGSRFLISTMPRSPVTCIWSFCRQSGKIFKLTIQVFSCYFCFLLNDILTELLGVVDDGWFS